MVFGLFKKKTGVEQQAQSQAKAGFFDTGKLSSHASSLNLSEEDRAKLKTARVFIIGCGETGRHAALFLAAAGVGSIGLADNTLVEDNDINDYAIFGSHDKGKRKSIFLADKMREIDPDINVVPSTARMRQDNLPNSVKSYPLVMDFSNHLPTSYLVSDACVISGKHDIYGFSGVEGVVATFGKDMPCFRCNPMQHETSKERNILLSERVGVFAAAQAIQILLGKNAHPSMKIFAGTSSLDKDLQKNPGCMCSNPSAMRLIDYEKWLGFKHAPESAAAIFDDEKPVDDIEITPAQVKERMGAELMLIDVREQWEHDTARIEGSNLIPMGRLASMTEKLPKDTLIVTYCHTGSRSLFAAEMLREKGLNAKSMKGGIDLWSRSVDDKVPRY